MARNDYEEIANEFAGPGAREAVRAVAEDLHANESMHMHKCIQDEEPCSYCWLRAGRALRTLRRFTGHPDYQAICEVPHLTIEEEEACEEARVRAAGVASGPGDGSQLR